MFSLFAILIVALSLSVDTFSLSISYGMLNITKNNIIKISIFVGLFHFFMPILGNMFGEMLFNYISIDESTLIGIIFLILSIEIIFSLYKEKEISSINSLFDIIIFSFTVSIDSFVTAICLDVFKINYLFVVSLFMIVSSLFTYIGLYFGFYIHKKLGLIAEIIGSILLITLSIFYLIY